MPIPLIVWAGYAITAAAVAAAGVEVASGERDEFEPPEALRRLAAAVINWFAGEKLLEAEDLTGKAGINAALVRMINERSPIKVTTLLDKKQFERDLLDGAAQLASKKAGFPMRTLFDRDMLVEDLMAAASEQIHTRTGLKINNFLDRDQVAKDVLAFGANKLATEAGIYLSDPSDIEQIKVDIVEHGAQMALSRVVTDLKGAMNATDKDNMRLSALLDKAGLGNVKPVDMVKGANSVLLGFANRRYAQVKKETKAERRKAQVRKAQQRFRARHQQPWSKIYSGVRGGMTYVPVGAGGSERAKNAPVLGPMVEEKATGAGYAPPSAEQYDMTPAKWNKSGKLAKLKGAEVYDMSRPTMPAGVPMGRRAK